jgi:hypothetical protein
MNQKSADHHTQRCDKSGLSREHKIYMDERALQDVPQEMASVYDYTSRTEIPREDISSSINLSNDLAPHYYGRNEKLERRKLHDKKLEENKNNPASRNSYANYGV